MARLVALLDANVLFPAPVRDVLLHLADLGSYQPKWSGDIQDEWIRNLLLSRNDLNAEKLQQTQASMDEAFPDAMVFNYQPLIETLALPDPDDRHVLAAAITGKASVIVSDNLRDFPNDILAAYNIRAMNADQFLSRMFIATFDEVVQAFYNQVAKLRRPPMTPQEILARLRACGLLDTANLIEQQF